jgi:hypothetical protein
LPAKRIRILESLKDAHDTCRRSSRETEGVHDTQKKLTIDMKKLRIDRSVCENQAEAPSICSDDAATATVRFSWNV